MNKRNRFREPASENEKTLIKFLEALEMGDNDTAVAMLEDPLIFLAVKAGIHESRGSNPWHTDDPHSPRPWLLGGQEYLGEFYSEPEKTLVSILFLNGRIDLIKKYCEGGVISKRSIKPILEFIGVESIPDSETELVNMVTILDVHDE